MKDNMEDSTPSHRTRRGENLRWSILPVDEFDSIRDIWDRVSMSNQDIPFLRSGFIKPLLKHFGTGRERVVLGTGPAGPVAAAVLCPAAPLTWQTFQPSQLPLGALVAVPDVDIRFVGFDLLLSMPSTVLQLGLTQLDPKMFPRIPDEGVTRTSDYIETAWLDVGGTYEEYWAARGKNLRKGLAKQRRDLEKDGIVAELDILTTPSDISEGLRDYATLESAGWKAAGGTAIAVDNKQGRFYSDVLEAFALGGSARVYRYRFNGSAVAVDLCIESESLQVVLKTTHDERIRRHSPALLMRQQLLALEWPQGRLKRVEFYGRRMEWHRRWTDNYRVLYHMNIYRWPALARMHAGLMGLKRGLKKSKTTGDEQRETSDD